MLPRDYMVNVKRARVQSHGHVAILTAMVGSVPDAADQIRVHESPLSASRRAARLGVDHRKQVGNVNIAIKLGSFFLSQITRTGAIGKLAHAGAIPLAEMNREEIARRFTRNALFRCVNQPRPDSRFEARIRLMSTHWFQVTALTQTVPLRSAQPCQSAGLTPGCSAADARRI